MIKKVDHENLYGMTFAIDRNSPLGLGAEYAAVEMTPQMSGEELPNEGAWGMAFHADRVWLEVEKVLGSDHTKIKGFHITMQLNEC